MKKILSIVVVLLLAIGAVACLSACGGQSGDEQETKGEPLTIFNDDGSFRYVVVRPEITDKKISKAASEVLNALKKVSGTNILIQDDWTKLPKDDPSITGAYELLIGKTNRNESATVLESLAEDEFAIQVLNNKIVVIGNGVEATVKAVKTFIATVLKYTDDQAQYNPSDLFIPLSLNIKGSYTNEDREEESRLEWEEYLNSIEKKTSKAQIIETKYPTNDIVIADFIATDFKGVDPTGQTDSTKGIQSALSACLKYGGGTVWLPEGQYLVTSQITIPNFVTLRGEWQNPDDVKDGQSYGTIIIAKPEAKDDNESGLFLMQGSGGAVGLTIFYPEQSINDIHKYPHTFYIRGDMLATITNITMINSYRGIGACCGETVHEQLSIDNVYGTYLHTGYALYNSSDVGTVLSVYANGSYWANCKLGEAPSEETIVAYTKANATGMLIGDLEWTEFADVHLSGYKYGVHVVKGVRIAFAGSFYDLYVDNCEYGMLISDMDTRWGMDIARASLEGSKYALFNETKAYVKCSGVTFNGEVGGENVKEYIDTDDLSAYAIDYKRSYVKPAAKLYIASLPLSSLIDSSDILQGVLNEAGKTGGIVYVPAGTYRFDKSLVVPANVELRGASSVPNRCQGGSSAGTVFYVHYGYGVENPDTAQAFITLSGENAGLSGIRIIFIENDVIKAAEDNIHSVFAVRGTAKGVYVVNSAIMASEYGIDFRNCDNHYIKKLVAWCYKNIITAGGKNGMIVGNLSNATVMLRTQTDIKNWEGYANGYTLAFAVSRYKLNYLILENAENEVFLNTFCYGCSSLVTVKNSKNCLLANIGADNIGENSYQMVFDHSDVTVMCVMRYNGKSFSHDGGEVSIYSRVAINEPKEFTYIG